MVGSATLLKTPPPPNWSEWNHILAEAKNQAVPLRGRTRHELNLFGRSMWSACASKNRQSRSRRKGRRGPQEMLVGCVLAVSTKPRFSGCQGFFCMDSEINQGFQFWYFWRDTQPAYLRHVARHRGNRLQSFLSPGHLRSCVETLVIRAVTKEPHGFNFG